MSAKHTPEVVGRKYTTTRYAIHTRRVGTETWYRGGGQNHATKAEAVAELKKILGSSRRYLDLGGGLAVDFGPDNGERYERRIVKIDSQCEVVATGVGPA